MLKRSKILGGDVIKAFGAFLGLILAAATSFAGSTYNLTKVKSISYKFSGELVVEIVGLDENKHFFSSLPPGTKKFRLSYLKWPKDSRYSTWWYRILPWTERSSEFDPKGFENCVKVFIESYKTGSTFLFGQVGGGNFEVSKEATDEVILPYLRLEKTQDGEACLIDLG